MNDPDKLYKVFLACPHQQKAYETLLTEILNGEFIWTNDKESSVIDSTDPEQMIWRTFTEELALQCVLYGYALYRPVLIKKRAHKNSLEYKDAEMKSQNHLFRLEVANGANTSLRWDKETVSWDVIYSKTKMSVFSNKKDAWRVVMTARPRRCGRSNEPLYASPAASAYRASCIFYYLEKHFMDRDVHNSDPKVYLFAAQRALRTKPTDEIDKRLDMNVVGAIDDNFDNWIQKRGYIRDKLRALQRSQDDKEITEYRRDQEKAGEAAPKSSTVVEKISLPDGYDSRDMPHIPEPGNLSQYMIAVIRRIVDAYGVPGPATGENGTPDRMAGNDRSTQRALQM